MIDRILTLLLRNAWHFLSMTCPTGLVLGQPSASKVNVYVYDLPIEDYWGYGTSSHILYLGFK